MSQTHATHASRPALSMQTEHARQQQLITVLLLLLLLGPLTLAVAGLVAGMVGKSRWRMAAAALGGMLALAAVALFWRTYREFALGAWAIGATAFAAMQAQQLAGGQVDYLGLVQRCWPPLWQWWQLSLLLAPLAALNLLSNRVRTAAELEQERFAREEQAAAERERQARARVAKAPDSKDGALVLGVPLANGDLAWDKGAFFTYPADNLARHAAVIGSSGMGKSETVLRLAYGAAQTYGWKVFFIDCKGERTLQERFAATMHAAGARQIGLFPQRSLNGWQGDGTALLNRLLAVVDYTEPYYKDLTKMLLNLTLEAPGGPPRSSPELLERMSLARLRQLYEERPEAAEIDGLKPKDAAASYNRYRAFFKALGSGLDGAADDAAVWSFDSVDAGYILLDGLSLKDQTASFGRFLVEDFAHYAAQRKPPEQKVLLIIDEYPVIAFSGAGTASLFEMVRFHGASIIVTGQSYAGMGEGFDRILGAAETLFLHRCGDPDKLLPRAGQRLTFKRNVSFSERGLGRAAKDYATGAGYLAVDEQLKIHPNDVKELPRGECFVIAGGRYQRVLVKRAPQQPLPPEAAVPPPRIEPAPVSSHAHPHTVDIIEVERHILTPTPPAPHTSGELRSLDTAGLPEPDAQAPPTCDATATAAGTDTYKDEE